MPTSRYAVRAWNYIEGRVDWKTFDCFPRALAGRKLTRFDPEKNGIVTLRVNEFNICEQLPNLKIEGTWNIDDNLTDIAFITLSLRTDTVILFNPACKFQMPFLHNSFVRTYGAFKTPDLDRIMDKKNPRFAYESQLDRTVAIGVRQDVKDRKTRVEKITSFRQFADINDNAWFYLPYESLNEIRVRLNDIKDEHGTALTASGQIASDVAVRKNIEVLTIQLELRGHETGASLLDAVASGIDANTLDPALIYGHENVSMKDDLRPGTYLFVNGTRVYNVIYFLIFEHVCRLPMGNYSIDIDKLVAKYAESSYEDLYIVETTDSGVYKALAPGQFYNVGNNNDAPQVINDTTPFLTGPMVSGYVRGCLFIRRSYYKNDFINSKSCSWRSSVRVKPLFCITFY